jgi:hypothetical protein
LRIKTISLVCYFIIAAFATRKLFQTAMSYKLRFVQHFKLGQAKEYLAIEKQFADLEQQHPEFPKGTRYMPVTGREPSNTLIWECDFETLEAAQNALAFLLNDTRHEALFETQSAFILDSFAEIYKPFDA